MGKKPMNMTDQSVQPATGECGVLAKKETHLLRSNSEERCVDCRTVLPLGNNTFGETRGEPLCRSDYRKRYPRVDPPNAPGAADLQAELRSALVKAFAALDIAEGLSRALIKTEWSTCEERASFDTAKLAVRKLQLRNAARVQEVKRETEAGR